ncbi:MAG: hypothetical protein KBT04_05000 [Bacteroidales bacterium]|nr:hypothetical protein [Candidatus Colimorpha onthohippi]
MKLRLLFYAIFVVLSFAAFPLLAQQPHKFSYQAVVRDASNHLVRNGSVGVRVSLYEGNPTDVMQPGVLKYQETQSATTNDNGLYTVVIGDGAVVSGALASVQWSTADIYLRIEADPLGGTNYTLTLTHQLLAVPYALYCNENQTLVDVLTIDNHAGMHQIKEVAPPTECYDAVTKCYFDSIMTTLVDLLDNHRYDSNRVACDSVHFNGMVLRQSGMYLKTLKNAAYDGTDSVVVLRLTIHPGTHLQIYDTACTGSYTWNQCPQYPCTYGHGTGSSYTTAGIYAGPVYIDQYNCPSQDTLHLHFGSGNMGHLYDTACFSYTWQGNPYFTSTDQPATVGHNASGCDSIVTLHLTILHEATGYGIGTDVQTSCGAYTWPLNGQTYTEVPSPAPTKLLAGAGAHGCDSMVTLSLTIHTTEPVVDMQQVCSGATLTWYGKGYTSATTDGSQTHPFTDVHGCARDSVLYLTLITPQNYDTTVYVCSGSGSHTTFTWSGTHGNNIPYSYSDGGSDYTHPNYYDANGCAATSTLHLLKADPSYYDNGTPQSLGVVQSSTLPQTVQCKTFAAGTAVGVYEFTCLTGQNVTTQCDDSTRYTLTIAVPCGSKTVQNICATNVPYAWNSGSYSTTGTYYYNYGAGCADTLVLTVENPSVTLGNIKANNTAMTSIEVDKNAELTLAANVSSYNGSLSYKWSTSSNFSSVASTSSTYSPGTSTTGTTTYYLRVTASTAAGCETYQDKSIDVTVKDACNVTISKLNWEKVGTVIRYYPFALKASYSVSPSDATLEWSWRRVSSANGTFESTPSYLVGDASGSVAYVFPESSSGTYWYEVKLTATSGGCSVSKTFSNNNVGMSSGSKGTNLAFTVTKSGKTITVSAVPGGKWRVCASAVPLNNQGCVVPATGQTSQLYAYSNNATSNSATATCTINLSTTPPSGTTFRVYCWVSSSGATSVSLSSYAKSYATYDITF